MLNKQPAGFPFILASKWLGPIHISKELLMPKKLARSKPSIKENETAQISVEQPFDSLNEIRQVPHEIPEAICDWEVAIRSQAHEGATRYTRKAADLKWQNLMELIKMFGNPSKY